MDRGPDGRRAADAWTHRQSSQLPPVTTAEADRRFHPQPQGPAAAPATSAVAATSSAPRNCTRERSAARTIAGHTVDACSCSAHVRGGESRARPDAGVPCHLPPSLPPSIAPTHPDDSHAKWLARTSSSSGSATVTSPARVCARARDVSWRLAATAWCYARMLTERGGNTTRGVRRGTAHRTAGHASPRQLRRAVLRPACRCRRRRRHRAKRATAPAHNAPNVLRSPTVGAQSRRTRCTPCGALPLQWCQ